MLKVNSLNNVSDNEANNNTIKILIKLFVINIVASSFLGFSSKVTTIFSFFPLSESSSKSVCDKEKKATSAPETSAELINKKNRPTRLIAVKIFTGLIAKSKISGSGSKSEAFKFVLF